MTSDFLPYGRQWINDQDITHVVEVLKSDLLTQGPTVEQFEQALASYLDARYVVAVSSGTAALHLACLAAEVGPGDQVITSPNTFVASANCALYCNAQPGFVDIDDKTYNLSPQSLTTFLTTAFTSPKAVIPVHFAGQPCDMQTLSDLASQHNFIVIEDACHALGAKWQDQNGQWQKVGNCSHSDIAVFSFHPVKHMTTGEGGAIATNDSSLYKKLINLRTHGITKTSEDLTQNDGPWYYEMHDLGYNYRITDLQCALGLSQLTKLDDWVCQRRQIAQTYNKAFRDVADLILPYEPPNTQSSYHLYVLQVKGNTERRKTIFETLRAKGIGTQVHYIPVHLQPYYQKQFGFKPGDFPNAEQYYTRCFSIPMFPHMTKADINRVIDTVHEVVVQSRSTPS